AQFRDYHAEKFSGQGDPRIVNEWIQGLELIFEVMDCPDRYRVICAQLQLTGDAQLWWNAYWSMRPGEKEGCTWDRLKELIREKYYPTYYRAEMERQFLSLKQGTRSVDEYEREFTRLAAFVPDLVRTEAQRAQRFIDGLYPAVRHNIVGHGTQTYAHWPEGCGPRAKLKIKKRRTKRRRKAKARKASQCCEPCAKKSRAQKKEAQRRGLRWVDKGWWIPADDCERLKGWDPWPEPTTTIADEKGDGDRPMGEWHASDHDARGWTEQDDVCGSSMGGRVADVDWDALAFGDVTQGR
ncbi:Unknown protein, partial [Striga hermonthica]